MARTHAFGLLVLLASAWAGAGCVSKEVRDSAKDVLTLRSGTVSELRDQRGQGPFHFYDVPPSAMLEIVAAACRKAVGLRGRPVTTVELSPRYGEVTAKEQAPDMRTDPSYSDDWRSAVVITVHAIPHEPERSRVEWHTTKRSPLLACGVDWEGVLPGLIDSALREHPSPVRGFGPSLGAPQ